MPSGSLDKGAGLSARSKAAANEARQEEGPTVPAPVRELVGLMRRYGVRVQQGADGSLRVLEDPGVARDHWGDSCRISELVFGDPFVTWVLARLEMGIWSASD